MINIKTSKNQLVEKYKNIYSVPYCRIEGVDDDFTFWQVRIKDRLNLDLLPVRYYNAGIYGWNFTAYPLSNGDLFICSYYRNIPSNAQDITEKLK